MKQAGPGFGVSSNLSIDLMFDCFEDIKKHEMANDLLSTIDRITDAVLGKSIGDIKVFKEKLSDEVD